MEICPQCGLETTAPVEGVCGFCWAENQRALDEHNTQFDWWKSLTDQQREDEIKRALL